MVYKKDNPIPSEHSDQDLAENLADIFVHKIMEIQNGLDQYALCQPGYRDRLATFNMFYPVMDGMVKELIGSMKSKLFELDLIPTTFLKGHLDDFVKLLSLFSTNH